MEAAQASARPLPADLRGSIRGVEPADPQARLVAPAFDLCEQANERSGYDTGVVDWLRAHRVKAASFAGGKWLRSHPERAMQLMADPLFEVGNHTWTHGNLRVIEGDETRRLAHHENTATARQRLLRAVASWVCMSAPYSVVTLPGPWSRRAALRACQLSVAHLTRMGYLLTPAKASSSPRSL